jgi:hypothetical protein
MAATVCGTTITIEESISVDHHIWPLRHPRVCGLHIPKNLRIVPAMMNQSKGNKLPEPIWVGF